MANPVHVSKLTVEGVKAWNEMQAALGPAGPMVAELQDADLSGKDLSGADLRGARLEGAKLRGTKFGAGTLLWNANITKADAYQADFSDAWLDDADFTGTDLFEAKFRNANLRAADLSNTNGFPRTEQFAGADLTGAKLPERLKTLYDKLENVKGISENARKIFLALLAACLYCWLTIATTTDVNLITNRASSPLPIIQTQIPIVGFYVVAPLLVLCVYFYFHFYLQKLWEELGALPAVFPDGRPLYTKVDPWLLNDLVRSHLPKLNVDRPFLSYLQLWISVLLAWWIVPITMFLFWARYLVRHERGGSNFHIAIFVISLLSANGLYRLAVATLTREDRKAFAWSGILTSRKSYVSAALAVLAMLVLSWASWESRWVWDYRIVTASLNGADVSQKKSAYDPVNYNRYSVIGAQLRGANLRHAFAPGAFFAEADLEGADLSGAILNSANMRNADLSDADLRTAQLQFTELQDADLEGCSLRGAIFAGSDLRDATLRGTELAGVVFFEADLTFTDLRETSGLTPMAVRLARNGDKAFYDDEGLLKALGLPPDHDQKLYEEQAQEEARPTPEEAPSVPKEKQKR
jgi:uncharacterized protein YjbI with pentapeptide repeats